MNRKPTAATANRANGANGSPVGRGGDPAGQTRKTSKSNAKTVANHRRRVPRIARRYARASREELAQQVRSIVLFGSQARGDARPGSDFDFVVVLDRIDRVARDKVSAAGAELLNETNRLCSALIYSPEQWDMVRQSPLGWNVVREGIVL